MTPDAVDTADPLLDPGEVPGQVVVDKPAASLKVQAFSERVGAISTLT